MPDQTAKTQVLKHINRSEMVELGKALIRIPSLTSEETSLARWLASWFSHRGYDVDIQEVERGWFQTIAVLPGSGGGGRSLMLNGHLDINPPASDWKRDMFDPWVEGNKLWGAGARNMKGPDAAMLHAAEAVRKSGVKLKGDLVIACVVAELQGGLGTVHLLNKGLRTDMAVVTEPYGAHHIVTRHAGLSVFALHIYGRHPAGKDVVGVDAIPKMCRAIQALYDTRLTHKPWSVNGLPWLKIGSVIGGRGENYNLRSASRNADVCTAFIAVSTVPGMTADTLRADFEGTLQRLKQDDPELEYRLDNPPDKKWNLWRVNHPPMDMPENVAIVKLLAANYEKITGGKPDIGDPASELSARYGDDDAHLWEAGIPAPIYGPYGGSYGEDYSNIDEMELCARVLATTAVDVCEV